MNQQTHNEESIESLKLKIAEMEKKEKDLLKMLQLNSSLYLKVLDALPINVFLEEPDGRTIFANKQACDLNGMTLEELVGKTVYDFFPEPIAKMNRDIDLEVWRTRTLKTGEVKAGFQGNESYMFTGKTIIHVPEFDKEYLLGFGLDITDLKNAEKKIVQMAYHDALTGLPNRWFIKSYLETYKAEHDQLNELLGVILLDLDHFKVVNDSLGHEAGDLLLKSVTERLMTILDHDNILARFGGDEFVLLAPHLHSMNDAVEVGNLILRVMNDSFMIYNQKYHITPSIGVSVYPFHGEDLNSLIKCADLAMYKSKEKGRNCATLYNPELNKRILENMDKITAAI
ncbi:diguanylate cyclase domain-containing protein [Neobacillus sp. LXY-1]|uniref:diguanylate cyclase domain-containing protein n=1 Tax=Neobacillus sp. LXY-1 TaxID=3379133 RepID=UPI003EDFB803